MVGLIAKIYINKTDSDSDVRYKYGIICSACGIFFNILLSLIKIIAGSLSASISLVADGINNLSDAASSIVTLIGFKLSNKKADREHPFGHGRIEYISGFIVSIFILIMGIELLKTSISSLIESLKCKNNIFSLNLFIILIFSILVKLYMYIYNSKVGKKINSEALRAVAKDSISDFFASIVVAVSLIMSKFINFNFDAVSGLVVSIFIIITGFKACTETLSPILGGSIDETLKLKIKEIALSYDDILGVHDIIVHDYGPKNLIATFHAEVSKDQKLEYIHNIIDEIEKQVNNKLGIRTTIHIDPVDMEDPYVHKFISEITYLVKERIDTSCSIHDLRIIRKANFKDEVVFDILVPFSNDISDDKVSDILNEIFYEIGEEYIPKFNIDRE